MPFGVYVEPFRIRIRAVQEVETVPVARVAVRSRTHGAWLTFLCAVDSGASYTALPRIDAPALGIDIRMGKRMAVSGVGGEVIDAWLHTITAEIGNTRLRLPILFLERDNAPRVLGRAGLFSTFSIILDGASQRTGFIHRRSAAHQAVRRILGS